jgi:BlaI family penicillinase repressor
MRLSDAEWTVMQPVWERSPATARDVHAAVEEASGWSYSTVRTLLTRLVEKGALIEGKRGNQVLYTANVSRDAARRSALRSLVERAFGGRLGSLVAHMAEEEQLSTSERAALAKLLEGGEPPARKPRKRR